MSNEDKALSILEAAFPDVLIIKQMMDANDIPYQEVMRALYLVSNIKKVAQWGKVAFVIKNGEIVTVTQEQQFVTQREMERIK